MKIFDRVKQKTITAGTGNITFSSSVASFIDFSDVYSNGDELFYTIENLTDFEVGIGTYSGNTLSRDVILSSSNNNSRINLPGNDSTYVFITYPASGAVYTTGDRIVTNVSAIDFNLLDNVDQPSYSEGRIFYDNQNKALAIYNDEADITLQLGQENYIRVRNNTDDVIYNGEAVLIIGSQGTWPIIDRAIADSETNAHAIGLATHDIESNSFGYITTYGIVRDLNTSAFATGQEIFLSPLISGGLTGVAPTSPYYKVPIGHVIRSHGSAGTILVVPGVPKLGGGDVKSLGRIGTSGVAFFEQTSANAGILASHSNFIYNSGNGYLGIGTNNPQATLEILPKLSTDIGMIVKGAAGQSENLTEWRNSSDDVLAYVDSQGNASFGDIIALGDLNVSGTLTYIHSTNVTIADKQLELASNSGSAISGDSYVDQGGIVLKSTEGDKEWVWSDATDAWTSSQNIDVSGINALGNLSISGGVINNWSTITQDHTLTSDSYGSFLSASSGILVTIPNSLIQQGRTLLFKSTSTYPTIISGENTTIDGQSTYTITNIYESITVVSNGSSWFII